MDGEVTRRRLLGTTIVGAGSAALLAACTGTDEARTSVTRGPAGKATTLVPNTLNLPAGADALGAGSFQLFSQEDLNFQILFALGGAGLNSEVGEVITAVDQANAATGGASYQSVYDAFIAMGNQVSQLATQSANNNRLVSARSQFLRAAQYYNQALYFVLGTSTPGNEENVFNTMNNAFSQAARMAIPVWQPVSIPYEGSNLPGYFISPPNASRRPTVILNNGSDGQNVDLWAYGAQAALDRGYNALMLTGPGQGEMLFVRQVPFRYDWENVITPVVNYLVGRPEVDPAKIVITGWSFGGLLVARAAAFEKRLAAVVSDPGFLNVLPGYPAFLQQIANAGDQQQVNQEWAATVIPGSTPEDAFTLKKRLEIFTPQALQQVRQGQIPTDWYTISRAMQQFDVSSVASQITAPYLVTDYQLDTFNPGTAQALYNALPPANKKLVNFTIEQGAQYHDAPMAPQFRNEVIFDWLDQTLGL